MTRDDMLQAVTAYGTPAYVFDVDMLKERIKMVRSCFDGRVRLCYAMKANPFLVKPLEDVIDKYEVCSPGEFHICEKSGISMDQIVVSGVNKAKADIAHSMEHYGDRGTYTIESLAHLELLEECARDADVRIRALIRVTSGNQFGVDEETVCRIIGNRERYPHVEVAGVQHYSGTQKKKISKMAKELNRLDELISKLKAVYEFETEELEYGPGFYVPYFQTDEETDDKALLKEFNGILESLKFKGKITLEMGRYLAAYCGYYFTSIADLKENQGQRYCIVDGGIHHLNYFGQTMAMKVPHYQHIKPKNTCLKEETWNVCGSLCTVNDVIVKQLPLSDPEVGDILVFERTGAYSVTEGIYLFLSRELPEILFREKRGFRSVRKRQGTDEINSEEK